MMLRGSIPILCVLAQSVAWAACLMPASVATYSGPNVQRSHELQVWPTYKNFPLGRRGFGVSGEDQLFAVSLPLPNRKLCSLEVTMRLRRVGASGLNDRLWIGFAPFTGPALVYGRRPWAGDAPTVLEKEYRFSLSVAEINRRIFSGQAGAHLDFAIHDDTAVDSISLRVWVY